MRSVKKSFSQRLKSEILVLQQAENPELDVESFRQYQHLFFSACLTAAAVFRQDMISIKSQNEDFIAYLQFYCKSIARISCKVTERKSQLLWTVTNGDAVSYVRNILQETLGFNTVRGSIGTAAEDYLQEEQQILLRGFLVTSGSVADPNKSYQIEFSIRRQHVLRFVHRILQLQELEASLKENKQNRMLYIKNGDDVSTFLAAVSANQAFLEFENARVKKNMNEMVNRAVNCDQANIQRVAETSARQISLIREIENKGGLNQLPEDLEQIARLRVQYPGYSLRELGEAMDPPLGKSGVNHRLGRLERWSKEYLGLE